MDASYSNISDIILAGYYGDIFGNYTKGLKTHEIHKLIPNGLIFYYLMTGTYISKRNILNVLPDLNTTSKNLISNLVSNIFIFLLKYKNINNLIDFIISFNIINYDLNKLKQYCNYKQNLSWKEYLKTNGWDSELFLRYDIDRSYQSKPESILCTALLAFLYHYENPLDVANAVIYYGGNTEAICKLACEFSASINGIEWIPLECQNHINNILLK